MKSTSTGTAPRFELIVPHGMWPNILNYLFADLSNEYACYLLCGHAAVNDGTRLYGAFLFLPAAEDYEHQSGARVAVRRSVLVELLQECHRLDLSLIDLHSHPFSTDHVAFSGVDDSDELEKANWFSQNLPNSFYGSIVLGSRSHEARIRCVTGRTANIPMVVRPLEVPLAPRFSPDPPNVPQFAGRHVRAFGAEGQSKLSAAHVGIVGLGGLGSAVAAGMARLGVQRFTLVDPDRATPDNLNRLVGMRAHDGRVRTLKTRLAKRELIAINPAITCKRLSADVTRPSIWRNLLDCDLVVAATDNHCSRFFLNALSEQYLIPQVSVGALIETDDTGIITTASGHVRVLLPGPSQACLLCSQIVDPTEVYYERLPVDQRRAAVTRSYITNVDEPAPSVVHLNGALANLALVEIHNLFVGFKPVNPYLYYDLLEQDVVRIGEEPLGCAICSPNGAFFARGQLADLDAVMGEVLPK